MRNSSLVLLAALGLLFAVPVQAHSMLSSSDPANGSSTSAPKELSMTFSKDVRLVTLKLTADRIDDIVLPVDRAAPVAKSFVTPLPALAPATYTVSWTASAEDGHVMKGKYSFTVVEAREPQAKP
jgi:copper resistance protein C